MSRSGFAASQSRVLLYSTTSVLPLGSRQTKSGKNPIFVVGRKNEHVGLRTRLRTQNSMSPRWASRSNSQAHASSSPLSKSPQRGYATYHVKVKPSLDARAALATLELATGNTQNDRNTADTVSIPLCQRVIGAVASDPDFGNNSDLYGAMGRKLKSAYASGLHRNKPVPPVTH